MANPSQTQRFLDLHQPGEPLVVPNPWDAGTAKLFASLGFRALATTSSGYAGTLGRADGAVTRDEVLSHAAAIRAATDLPVTADLEGGFADEPSAVAETVRRAAEIGLAGCSIEDYTGNAETPIYDATLATERIAAAAAVARDAETRIVLTARAENYLRGRPNLDDTIARLQSFEAAGADVVYAPGLVQLADIERVVNAVAVPVNVLFRPGGPTVAELAAAGVARVSIGGALYLASLASVASAARELLEDGTYGFAPLVAEGVQVRSRAFQ